MSRVLALVGAVVLIVGAVLAKRAIDDEGGDDVANDDTELVVHCIPELREACELIDRPMDLTIAEPQVTIDAVADGEDIDAWVTLDPWPQMAGIIDNRAEFDSDRIEPVAVTELVIVARGDAVPSDCPDPFTWTCLIGGLGDQVAAPDGDSALGRLVLGQAGNDLHPGFASNELESDDALRAALDTIDSSTDDPAGEMLLLPDPDAAGTTRADYDAEISTSPRADGFTSSPSGAPATVAIVVAGPESDRIAGEPSFTAALQDLGWFLDSGAATTGLPSPGVLVALGDFVG